MKPIILLITILLSTFSAGASTTVDSLKTMADSAYASEHYAEALHGYRQLAAKGENATVFYNLGCTYYRLDSIPQAILWLERAALLEPGDKDIRFNLDMARSKTIDRIVPQREMFFVTFWRSLVNFTSASGWGYIGLGIFFVAMLMLMMYFYSDRVLLRQIGFVLCGICFVCVILSNVCAYQQEHSQQDRRGAIVMSSAVTVKSTPSASGTDLFVIHEGTYVTIDDDSMKSWVEVHLSDGKEGWIERSSIERI